MSLLLLSRYLGLFEGILRVRKFSNINKLKNEDACLFASARIDF